ncbi:MAG: carbohydrate-binding protein, partial [Blautia sp.]|nr:carbohydrate-binding protein [Blautia sp.]
FVDFPTYLHGNNHGSLAKINGSYYFFGHRHSNGNRFSRQAWAGKLNLSNDEATGDPIIEPMDFTSCGIADSLDAYAVTNANSVVYLLEAADHPAPGTETGPHAECAENTPFVIANRTRDAAHASYITNLKSGNIAGFKYLGFGEAAPSTVKVLVSKESSDADGSIKVYLDAPTEDAGGALIGTVDVSNDSVAASVQTEEGSDGKTWYWVEGTLDAPATDIHAVYFVFESEGTGNICEFDAFQFQ